MYIHKHTHTHTHAHTHTHIHASSTCPCTGRSMMPILSHATPRLESAYYDTPRVHPTIHYNTPRVPTPDCDTLRVHPATHYNTPTVPTPSCDTPRVHPATRLGAYAHRKVVLLFFALGLLHRRAHAEGLLDPPRYLALRYIYTYICIYI